MSAFGKFPPPRNFTNLPSGQPVCIAVSYNTIGEFLPRWFGVEINFERFRFEITAVNAIKDIGGVRSFYCAYEDRGEVRMVLLKYYINEHRWVIG